MEGALNAPAWLQEEREVTEAEGHAFAREHATLFVECSAKTKVGIEQVFAEAVTKASMRMVHPNVHPKICAFHPR